MKRTNRNHANRNHDDRIGSERIYRVPWEPEPGVQMQSPDQTEQDSDRDEQVRRERYEQDILKRGDAARRKDGKLPPGVTHEIVEKDGKTTIKRSRYSLY